MTTLHVLTVVLKTDGLRIARDRFVVGLALYLVGLTLVARWALPFIEAQLQLRIDFDLRPYMPLVMSYFLLSLPPITPGLIGGFMLIGSRESGVLRSLRVTPLPLSRYLCWSGIWLALVAAAFSTLQALLLGFLAHVPPLAMTTAILVAAPVGAFAAYLLGAQSSNSVEALANSKFISIAALLPVGAYFVPEPWQFLAGGYPPYWACKLYWSAAAGQTEWPWYGLLGALTTLPWLYFAERRFAYVAA